MNDAINLKLRRCLTILMVAVFSFVCIEAPAQTTGISIKYKDASFQEVFKQIEQVTGYKFFYKTEQINKLGRISVNYENVALEKCLSGIFDGTQFDFKIVGRQIVVVDRVNNNKTVSGIIVDNIGEPLPGVAVIVKGTNTNAVSNMDGAFSIEADPHSTLQFIVLGMKDKEVALNDRTWLDIEMTPHIDVLDEVVVTGYGNFKKSTYTGSASVVSAEKLKSLPIVSFTQMLEGNVPGVTISSTSGQPGSATTTRVRGRGSINASNEPLYVLDGVPISSANLSNDSNNAGGLGILSTINPADIERITVLKDAASASLYGARGANGVILINTRKGVKGKTMYNVKANIGVSDFACNYREFMGGDERRSLIYEGFVNNQMDKGKTLAEAQAYANSVIDNYAAMPEGGYADWVGALFKRGLQQNYDFSAIGGSDNTRFTGSLNYTNQEGVSLNSGFERFSGRLGFNNKYRNFELGMNALISLTDNKATPEDGYYASALYTSRYSLTPSDPIYNKDGSYNTNLPLNGNYNPIYENTVNKYYTQNARTFASIDAGYTFIEGLKLSTTFNVDMAYTKEFRYWSPLSHDGMKDSGDARMGFYQRINFNSNTLLSYVKKIGRHNIDAAAAYEVQSKNTDYAYARATGYGQLVNIDLDNATTPKQTSQSQTHENMVSWVARVNYDYNSRYYVGLSFRRDGSSRLAPGNRWDNFWAVSGSWRAIEEDFMANAKSWLSDLKVRASYGVNGNLPYSLYGFYGTYSTSNSYNGYPALVESTIANPNLSWEKNYAANIGLDFGLFSRINVTFDWYRRYTKDLLMSKTVNNISGFDTIIDNVGEMENKGFELEIMSTNIDRKDFYWTTSINFASNKNRIVKLADVSEYEDGRYIRREGYSYGSLYLREYAGVDPQTGLPQYYTNKKNDDGTVSRDIVNNPNNAFKTIVADIYPWLTGGFINTLQYRQIALSFNFTYSLGGHSYDNVMYATQDDGYSASGNKSVALRERWQQPGDVTDVPRYVSGQQYGGWFNSSRGVHSTDHIRLKNLTLSYSLPHKLLESIKFRSAKIYFSGTNLLTWAKYKEYDPELQGVVYFNVPPLRTYALGIELGF